MRLSHYFEDLNKAYRAEIEDLQTDSEGKDVLSKRLKEKRSQFSELMPMIGFAPEMVVPAFHGGISFTNAHAMTMLSSVEPEEFPLWSDLVDAVHFDVWAEKLADIALREPEGERFMCTVVCLEFLHGKKSGKHTNYQASASDDEEDGDKEDQGQGEGSEDDERDLDEAGADWMAEQGFDRRE